MDTTILTSLHIEAPVEMVYEFVADVENWNQLKTSGMRGTIKSIKKTADAVDTTFRASGYFDGTWFEITGRITEAVPNERIVITSVGQAMETRLSEVLVFRMQPEGSGTDLTVESTPSPTNGEIPVLGLGALAAHEPVWADMKELLEGEAAAYS